MRKLIFLSSIINLILVLLLSVTVYAQDGSYDRNFGPALSKGIVTLPSGTGSSDNLSSVLVQSNGSILLGGVSRTGIPLIERFYINRILSNGDLDITFNSGTPKIILDSSSLIGAIVAQKSDGTILYAGGRGPYKTATAGKLKLDGSDIITPVGPYAVAPSNYQHFITSMSYNKTNDRMAVGGYVSLTTSYALGLRFNSSCILDNSFKGNGKIYFGSLVPTPNVTYARAVINMDDGSTLLACDSAFGGYISVVKLKPNGSFDTNFGKGTGVSRIYLGPTYSYGSPRGLALMPNGQIMVCGNAGGNFAVYRLNANGSKDNSFNALPFSYGGSSNIFTSIIIQPDKKVIVSGYSTAASTPITTGIIVRYKENGDLDSTFGTDGKVIVSTLMTINASALSESDKCAVFVGKEYSTNKMTVVKLRYDTQQFNILGKNIVSISTENTYNVHPYIASDNYTFQWSYSSTNIFSSVSSSGDSITLFFKSDTPSGILTCIIKNSFGVTIKTLTKEIKVSQEPTLAEMLTKTNCSQSQTRCQSSYINSFRIDNDTALTTSGCSETGYFDNTSLSDYDTLFSGDNYQAYLNYVGATGATTYAGVWIDFNNDGEIDESKEYVGSSYSETGALTVSNIQIPSETELGPKRLRVRVRSSAPFTANSFCPTNDEEGETEDYLVLINKYEGVKTPNFITPNGDGKNDIFIVRGVEKNSNNNLKIFNRVGDLVYNESNYNNNWSGKDQTGNALKSGTYYYVFTQENSDKKKDDVVKGFLEVRY